ncbi:hypothetical protein AAFF_G00055790 [Aldrovandia affinis]|uniref:Uncharacterized protein n=1 Tax=Aldrovandia affinis TaxID=143900 RepID=A0AAD7S0R0_9TELE|nr:hypothetical protein AAFF_G00055790 [Aldrovandia affinis]
MEGSHFIHKREISFTRLGEDRCSAHSSHTPSRSEGETERQQGPSRASRPAQKSTPNPEPGHACQSRSAQLLPPEPVECSASQGRTEQELLMSGLRGERAWIRAFHMRPDA